MKKNNKITRVSNLKGDEFLSIVNLLVENLGYFDIQNKETYISGIFTVPLGTVRHVFLLFDRKLENGITDFDIVRKRIEEVLKISTFNMFYVVSNHTLSKAFKNKFSMLNSRIQIDYIDRDQIVELIDKFKIDYWRHSDSKLLKYEKYYSEIVTKDTELKRLKIFDDKYSKSLDFFIDPSIFYLKDDKESRMPTRLKVNLSFLLNRKNPIIISGDAGTGKTTVLKKLGMYMINYNIDSEKKSIPLFISASDILTHEFAIANVIDSMIKDYFESDFNSLTEDYSVYLLIDSIDEFEEKNRKKILIELDDLFKKYNIIYILCTRNQDRVLDNDDFVTKEACVIEKFTNEQIKQFVGRFFINDKTKAESFIDALKDNRILDRLPITPLSLSLISILFEEKDFEIPATISDIYDNFNALLLGKALVNSRFEFIDINFKERILSIYGLFLLKETSNAPLTIDDFYKYFEEYFKNKSIPVEKKEFHNLLNFLIINSGVLTLKDNKYVQFTHNSFMEYYASLEIFNHNRDYEDLLIDNFFESGWQNTAIFYAGKSKDMPFFLKKINTKVNNAKELNQFYSGVMGLGYLLQALYQTDNLIRKESISISLEANIKAYETLIKIASDKKLLFKDYRLPLVAIINLVYFYENFNSITLREPLKLIFNEIFEGYKSNNNTTIGYKLLKLALTLNSNRINSDSELEKLIFDTKLVDDPTLNILTNFALSNFKNPKYREFKKKVLKSQYKLKDPIKKLIEEPIYKLRHGSLNEIKLPRKVKILTEGITDADIIEHAFMTLTNGNRPYWEINKVQDGGANALARTLVTAENIIHDDELIIGIFDNDSKGIQEFNGALKNNKFSVDENIDRLKKHNKKHIYALKLPVPQNKQHYIKDDQNFNFFAIEHYFPKEYLDQHEMLIQTEIKDIYKINDKKKTKFSNAVCKESNPQIFRGFVDLLEAIDNICKTKIDYVL